LEMKTVNADFKNLINLPKNEIKLKKSEGTDPIPGLLNDVDVIKENIGKLIAIYMPNLYNEWLTINKVGTPTGVRQTSFVAFFTDAETGVPLRKVKVTLNNGVENFIKYSTTKGYVRFFSLESDNYSMTAEHASFVTQQKSGIGIDDQHFERMDVKLQKINTSGDNETTTGILSLIAYDILTKEPMEGVLNSISSLKYSNTTDEDGEDYADGIKPGDYQGTLFFDGYKPLNYAFTIEAGKTTTLQLYMEKE
jgi:hypothetical protein